jgi:hypothetical protein
LLKEIAPSVTRVAVLRDPSFAAGIGLLAAMQATVEAGVMPVERRLLTPREALEAHRASLSICATFAKAIGLVPVPLNLK